MSRLLGLAALAVACSTTPAHALESFSVPYGGVATIPIDCTFQPLSCGIFTFTWKSVLTLQTASGADGVYRFDSYPPDNPSNTLTFLSLVSDESAAGAFYAFDLSSLDANLGIVAAWRQGERIPVAQPQLLEPLGQPAVDEQAPAVVFEEIARSGHGAGGTEEISRMRSPLQRGQDDLVPGGSRALDARQAPSNTAKKGLV